jgi:STAG domain
MYEDETGQGEAAAAHVFDDDPDDSASADDEPAPRRASSRLHSAAGVDKEESSDDDEGDVDAGRDDGDGYAGLVCRATVAAAREAARSWLARVQVDGPGAMANALCMAVDAARPGVVPRKELITPSMLIRNDPAAAVAEVCDAMVDDAADKTRYFAKKGHVVYSAFWRALVEEAEHATLHDTDCFDMLVRWLEEMTIASSRPLRLSACYAAYSIVDGLITVGLTLRSKLETAQGQLETEEKRKVVKKGALSARGKKLRDDVYAFETDLVEIDELKQKIFASIFTLKYRDVSPEVRAASVTALVDWALRDTAIFLADSHNKYAGWVLFDKAPLVRRTALEAVTLLFKGVKSVSSLDVFLSRFRDRIVAMSEDSDNDVCVAAVNLCTVLVPLEVFVGKVSDNEKVNDAKQENVDTLCALTSSDNAELRKAAGAFASAIVELSGDVDENTSPDGAPKASSVKGKRGRLKKVEAAKAALGSGRKKMRAKVVETAATAANMDIEKAKGDLREIVFTVLGDDAGDVTASGLVLEAVWEHLPAVHCWQAYRELLLEYNGNPKSRKTDENQADFDDVDALGDDENDQLSRNDMVSVASLLLAAAKQVCQGPRKKGRSKSMPSEASAEERLHLTNCFVASLPKLMTLYRTDPLVMRLLAELPRMFDLEACLKSGGGGDFKKMLAKLGDVLTRNTGSPEVVTAAARTLKHLSSSEDSLADDASVALRKELAGAARALHAVVRTGVSKASPAATGAALMRANVLSELVEIPKTVADDGIVLLRACSEGASSMSTSAASVDVCRLVANSLMWESAGLVASAIPSDGTDIDEDAVENAIRSFAARRDDVLSILALLLKANVKHSSLIRQAAFKSACLVTSISVGLYRRIQTASRQAETNSAQGTSLSEHVIDLMRVDMDEQGLSDGLSACFLDVIASHFHELETSPSAAGEGSDDHGGAVRDMLAGLCQMAFVGGLPHDKVHIPLLGLLLKNKRGRSTATPDVLGFDMAKVYYSRLKSTLPAVEVTVFERRVLHEAAKVDLCVSPSVEPESLHAVRYLASAISREYSATRSDAKGCGKLLKALVATDLKKAVGDVSDGSETTSDKVCIVCVAGSVLASRISKSTASALLQSLEELNVDNADDFGFAELRQCIEAAAQGKPAAVSKRPMGTSKRITSEMRRRGPGRKKKTPKSVPEGRRQTVAAADAAALRRSGRTQRVTYVEPDSDEESESEVSDLDAAGGEAVSFKYSAAERQVMGVALDDEPECDVPVEEDASGALVSRSDTGNATASPSGDAPAQVRRKRSNSTASPPSRKSPRLASPSEATQSPVLSKAPAVKRSKRGRRW